MAFNLYFFNLALILFYPLFNFSYYWIGMLGMQNSSRVSFAEKYSWYSLWRRNNWGGVDYTTYTTLLEGIMEHYKYFYGWAGFKEPYHPDDDKQTIGWNFVLMGFYYSFYMIAGVAQTFTGPLYYPILVINRLLTMANTNVA